MKRSLLLLALGAFALGFSGLAAQRPPATREATRARGATCFTAGVIPPPTTGGSRQMRSCSSSTTRGGSSPVIQEPATSQFSTTSPSWNPSP